MKRGLCIFFGEAFRQGGNECRLRDTDLGFQTQQESSISHNSLIKKLELIGYTIDIALHTYTTKFEKELLSWYSNIVYSNFIHANYGETKHAVHNTVQNALKNISYDIYDFIFILRFDMYLKELFIANFDPTWNKIMFMNAMHHLANSKLPHISDPCIFIPRAYFFENKWKGLLENTHHLLYHQACGELIKNGLTMNSIGFISEKTYPTNTEQFRNPYFRLNSRPEGPEIPSNFLNIHFDCKTLEFVNTE
jgi:hypothetical protein